jgi:hypothetical protein
MNGGEIKRSIKMSMGTGEQEGKRGQDAGVKAIYMAK